MSFKKKAKVEKIAVLAPYEHKLVDEELSTSVTPTKQASKTKKSLLKRLDNRKKSA